MGKLTIFNKEYEVSDWIGWPIVLTPIIILAIILSLLPPPLDMPIIFLVLVLILIRPSDKKVRDIIKEKDD